MKNVMKTTGKIGMGLEIRKLEFYNKLLRKLIIAIMVFLFIGVFINEGFGQLNKYQIKSGYKLQSRSEVEMSKDSNFFIASQEFSFSNGYNEVKFSLISKNSTLIWTKTLDSLFYGNSIQSIIATNDNGYIIGFNISEKIDSNIAIFSGANIGLIKLDSNGNFQWKRKFGVDDKVLNHNDLINSIKQDKDSSSFYVLGTSNSLNKDFKSSINFGLEDIWIIKLDINGNKIWDKSYGGINKDNFLTSEIKNHHLVILSKSESDSSGNRISKKNGLNDIWVIKINYLGNKLFDKSIFPDCTMPTFDYSKQVLSNTNDNCFLMYYYYTNSDSSFLSKLDSNFNIIWNKQMFQGICIEKQSKGKYLLKVSKDYKSYSIIEIDLNGNEIDSTIFKATSGFDLEFKIFSFNGKFVVMMPIIQLINNNVLLSNILNTNNFSQKLFWIEKSNKSIKGSTFPDFNSNCLFNKPSEYNIKNTLIHNKVENTYAITNDSIYTMYLFDRDTAILKVINLDSNLYVACGKDSIVVDMTGKTDTSGIDFPIRSTKTGSCVKITSFSHSIMRPGLWGNYQLNYQNNAFDTAYNAYIDVEIDTAKIDSITSPYSFTKIGNILRFQIGNVRPFGTSSIRYSVKLRTTVIIGSSICHRASVYPRCNLFAHPTQDSSVITMSMICRPNDTIEVQLKNIGTKNQSNWGIVKSYEDIIILYQDTFKLNVGNSRIFKYKLDTNKVYTAEVFNNNGDPINPILIRHDDQCANKKPIIFNNPALQFNRHDEAREYEEDCDIVRGSYDPNMKSVIPVGLFSEHYTSTGTELKYRIDFQNTGTDTAYRVVLVDTLSTDLNIASFVPGVSSHPYSIEFGGRAVKFIFDPIKLVDSFHNEPLSHGFVCFKINHVSGISPKTKIENKADIYFDYNTAVRTNTVFNTIFDTIQIYVPKGGGGTGSILGQNQMITDIYPNPASEKVFISMSESVKELSIEMIDMSGRLVQKQISKNDKSVELNVSQLQKGIYILRCMSEDKLVVVKKVEIK